MSEHEIYSTPSMSDPSVSYTISFAHNHYVCSCPGYSFRGKCKHADALNSACFIAPDGREINLKELGA